MSASTPTVSGLLLPLTDMKRALGWNLGRVVPTETEMSKLTAAGLTDPVAQRYAVWRRSLLIVAGLATLVAFVLAGFDLVEAGLADLTVLRVAVELAWLATSGMLPVACLIGICRWETPGSSSWLLAAWAAAFLMPFVYALLPVGAIYHVEPIDPATASASSIALLVMFVLTKRVIGLNVVGFDRDTAVATKLEELSSEDEEVSLEDVQASLAEADSFLYAFDLSS